MSTQPSRKRQVTVIPTKTETDPVNVLAAPPKRNVAGYARVSTDSKEQRTSYEAQVSYYKKLILSREDWNYVDVFTDEGISATSMKKRDGFNEMIRQALNGEIDLIITKSVSRFARNTVDTLVTIRKLKEKGVEVYFEKENIYTLDSKGELLITIMGSLAQEESRSISENVTWGKRKRIADGKFSLPYKNFLGYRKGTDGLPEIVEEQAEIVRLIYRLFLYGKSPSAIAAMLTNEGILTPGGKTQWRANTVESILTNEKYKGDALLQKKYTVDFLTKRQKVNEGEVPQYYVQNSHPAIIQPDIFDLVQTELRKRKQSGRMASSAHVFSGKLFCGDCGGMFGSKVWHSNSQYRRVIWQCNERHRGKRCDTPHMTDDRIKAAFLKAFNHHIANRDAIVDGYSEIIATLTDTSMLDAEAAELQNECDVVQELSENMISENASVALDQEEYARRFAAMTARYEKARGRLSEIEEERQARNAKRFNIERCLESLRQCGDLVTEFDEELWYTTVDLVTVTTDQRLVFNFLDGSVVTVHANQAVPCTDE